MSEAKGMGITMKRWFVVLGAIIIQLNLGAVYAWSLFNQPLINEFGWARQEIGITFSIKIAMLALFAIIAGRIQDKVGPRWVATFGGLLLGSGVILSSQATTLTQLYIFYGFIGGAGLGFAYVCPLSACVKWFPEKRGLISGVAVAGFGLGGLIYTPVILFFIERFGVSNAFFYLGIMYLILVVTGAQLLSNPEEKPEDCSVSNQFIGTQQHFAPSQMLKTYQFYLLWVMYFLGTMAGLLVISFAVNIGEEVANLTSEKAGHAVMVIAIFNAAGRILLGKISDNIGRINTLVLLYGTTATMLFYMSMADVNYGMFLVSVALIGLCFGGFLALFPSVTADYYGTRNIGTNYGFMYMAYGISAFVGPFVVSAIPFTQAFFISAILCIFSIILSRFVNVPTISESASTNEPFYLETSKS